MAILFQATALTMVLQLVRGGEEIGRRVRGYHHLVVAA